MKTRSFAAAFFVAVFLPRFILARLRQLALINGFFRGWSARK